jgi:hypothetical protein
VRDNEIKRSPWKSLFESLIECISTSLNLSETSQEGRVCILDEKIRDPSWNRIGTLPSQRDKENLLSLCYHPLG